VALKLKHLFTTSMAPSLNCAPSGFPQRHLRLCDFQLVVSRLRSLVVLVLALPASVTAQLCLPVSPQPIQFSALLEVRNPSANPTGPGDTWILSDQSVHHLSEDGSITAWALPGQPQPNAVVVVGDSVWIGTTAGAVRYRRDEPNVTVEFVDAGSQRGSASQSQSSPVIDNISVAFDSILLSSSEGVYRFDMATPNHRAYRTTLPPGRAYGHGPHWWVTQTGVYLLSKTFSVAAPASSEEPGIDPVVASGYLWVASKRGRLVAISDNGVAEPVPDLVGPVRTLGVAQIGSNYGLASDVWVATDQALWRVRIDVAGSGPSKLIVNEEAAEPHIKKLLVLKDRLFFSRCSKRDACSPSLWERLISDGKLNVAEEAHSVADATSDFWAQNSTNNGLYVPTENGLISYSFATRKAEVLYGYATRFVQTWGAKVLLGSPLEAQRTPLTTNASISTSLRDTVPVAIGDRFANLCRLEPSATVSARFEGTELFDWYIEPLGIKTLLGNSLRASPILAQNDRLPLAVKPGDLQICNAPCKKEEDWSSSATLSGSSTWIASQTFNYQLRRGKGGEEFTLSGRIILIPQLVLWSFCGGVIFVGLSSVLVMFAGLTNARWSHVARVILFRIMPDGLPGSALPSWLNLPILIVTSIDTGLWWFVRPILLYGSEYRAAVTAADRQVVSDASTKSFKETSLVVYQCLPDEAEERAGAIRRVLGEASLRDIGTWRMPLIVRLDELPDADVKKALLQYLHQFTCDNNTLADRLLRSGRIVYVFIGSEELKGKVPSAAILQASRLQSSRSIVVTSTVPTWGGAAISASSESERRKTTQTP